jgi:hypothetical protein
MRASAGSALDSATGSISMSAMKCAHRLHAALTAAT